MMTAMLVISNFHDTCTVSSKASLKLSPVCSGCSPTQLKHQLCMSQDSVINCMVITMKEDAALLVQRSVEQTKYGFPWSCCMSVCFIVFYNSGVSVYMMWFHEWRMYFGFNCLRSCWNPVLLESDPHRGTWSQLCWVLQLLMIILVLFVKQKL